MPKTRERPVTPCHDEPVKNAYFFAIGQRGRLARFLLRSRVAMTPTRLLTALASVIVLAASGSARADGETAEGAPASPVPTTSPATQGTTSASTTVVAPPGSGGPARLPGEQRQGGDQQRQSRWQRLVRHRPHPRPEARDGDLPLARRQRPLRADCTFLQRSRAPLTRENRLSRRKPEAGRTVPPSPLQRGPLDGS